MRINDLKYNTLKTKKNLLDHDFKEIDVSPVVRKDAMDDQLEQMERMMLQQKQMLE
jgi:hypothetical protein